MATTTTTSTPITTPISRTTAPRSTGTRPAAHDARSTRTRAARGARPVCAAPVRRRPLADTAPETPAGRRTRITRRGRVLLLLVLAALLFAAFSVGRSASQAASEPVEAVQLEQTTVQPGDTLWAVARRIAPDNDPREVIDQIRRLNDLTGSELTAGQQLMLPAAG